MPTRPSSRLGNRFRAFAATALVSAALASALLSADQRAFLGRWNLTSTGEGGGAPYWLEVKDEGGKLTALFLNRTDRPLRVETVTIEGEELVFRLRGREDRPGPEFRARVDGDRLSATLTQGTRTIALAGVRPIAWRAADANAAHTFGAPVVLFDGGSIDAFDVQHRTRPVNWSVVNGELTNGEHANNLVSKEKFTDFAVRAEYRLAPKSNSGIYLRGRYELQLFDDHGQPPSPTGHMAIYGRTAPRVNASKPAGEWQTMDAVIVGNRVSVTLNGQRVHDNAVIEGITGGALDNDEAAPGPLMVQGDHSQVWIRKLIVTPIVTK